MADDTSNPKQVLHDYVAELETLLAEAKADVDAFEAGKSEEAVLYRFEHLDAKVTEAVFYLRELKQAG